MRNSVIFLKPSQKKNSLKIPRTHKYNEFQRSASEGYKSIQRL